MGARNLMAWACWLGWHNWTVTRTHGCTATFDERCGWCGKRRPLTT